MQGFVCACVFKPGIIHMYAKEIHSSLNEREICQGKKVNQENQEYLCSRTHKDEGHGDAGINNTCRFNLYPISLEVGESSAHLALCFRGLVFQCLLFY